MQEARFKNHLKLECASSFKLQPDHKSLMEPNGCSIDSFVGGLVVQEANYETLNQSLCDSFADPELHLNINVKAFKITVNR